MYRKSFYLTVVLCASMLTACSSGPTVINSTRHLPEPPPSNAHNSANGGNVNQGTTNNSMTNSAEMNHSSMKSAPAAANQP